MWDSTVWLKWGLKEPRIMKQTKWIVATLCTRHWCGELGESIRNQSALDNVQQTLIKKEADSREVVGNTHTSAGPKGEKQSGAGSI